MKKEQIIYVGKSIPFENPDFKHQPCFYRNIIRLVNDIPDSSEFIEVHSNGKVTEQKVEKGLEDTVAS